MLLTQLEIPLETVEYLAAIALRERIPLILDPAPARPLPASLLKCVDWLTPNETESSFLLGRAPEELSEAGLKDAANTLLALGSRNVILKLGKRGCYVALMDGTRKLLPATPCARGRYHGRRRRLQWRFRCRAAEQARSSHQRLLGIDRRRHFRYSSRRPVVDANPCGSGSFPRRQPERLVEQMTLPRHQPTRRTPSLISMSCAPSSPRNSETLRRSESRMATMPWTFRIKRSSVGSWIGFWEGHEMSLTRGLPLLVCFLLLRSRQPSFSANCRE